jgi:hypothetical protein
MLLQVRSLNANNVKCSIFLSDFNRIWIFLTDFYESLNIKCNENLSGGSRVHSW